MGEVVIRLDGRIMERIVYWIIIIVLAVLLVMSYLGDGNNATGEVTAEEQGSTNTGSGDGSVEVIPPEEQVIPEEEPEPLPTPDETCFDGEKNQDEKGPDCGGTCASINGAYWYDEECHDDPKEEEPDLSGKVEFSVTKVEEKSAPGDGDTAIKVSSFTVKVTNGKPDNIFPTVRAFAKNTGGSYLNQFGDALDDYTAYMGPVDLGKIASGETVTLTVGGEGDEGSYIFEQAGYDVGEDFKLVVDLLDSDGDKIDQVSKTVKG